MSRHREAAALAVAFVIVACGPLAASEIYWTGQRERPNYIVVGSMREIVRGACEVDHSADISGGLKYIEVRDAGWIEIESVIWGSVTDIRLPVSWYARSRKSAADSTRDDLLYVSGERNMSEGDRGIWVLWDSIARSGCDTTETHWFQFLPMSMLDRVTSEVEQLVGQ